MWLELSGANIAVKDSKVCVKDFVLQIARDLLELVSRTGVEFGMGMGMGVGHRESMEIGKTRGLA